jgi:hypothetical protein
VYGRQGDAGGDCVETASDRKRVVRQFATGARAGRAVMTKSNMYRFIAIKRLTNRPVAGRLRPSIETG